jgi:hypothetical protein
MPLQLADAILRPLLRDDIKTAWSLSRVRSDPPQIPGVPADLPQAFLQLRDVETAREAGQAGFGETQVVHTYVITGQFVYPVSGTLEEAKVEKANALLSVLTTVSTCYQEDYLYHDPAVRFEDVQDATEAYYTVVVEFPIIAVTTA